MRVHSERRSVTSTVPRGFRYAMLIVAPALAGLIVSGAPLIHAVLPKSLSTAQVGQLQTFAALLVPWTVCALLVNFLLPMLFAVGRARLLSILAVPLVLLHIAATAIGSALFGVDGAVGAFFVAPACFAGVLLYAGAGRQGRRRYCASWRATPGASLGSRRSPSARAGHSARSSKWLCSSSAGWRRGLWALCGRPALDRSQAARDAHEHSCRPSRAGVSTTLAPPLAAAPAAASPSSVSTAKARRGPGDRAVLGVLALCFLALTALTWRKWGVPEIDAGAELTTADLVKHGAVAYRDVRYYYGPLGLYSLALSFKVFGSSFTTAFAFGLAQTVAILAGLLCLGAPLARAARGGLGDSRAARDRLLWDGLQLHPAPHRLGHVRGVVPTVDAARAHA